MVATLAAHRSPLAARVIRPRSAGRALAAFPELRRGRRDYDRPRRAGYPAASTLPVQTNADEFNGPCRLKAQKDWVVAQILYDWQTVIAGVLALAAAWWYGRTTKLTAQNQITAAGEQTKAAVEQTTTTILVGSGTRRKPELRVLRHARGGNGAGARRGGLGQKQLCGTHRTRQRVPAAVMSFAPASPRARSRNCALLV